jgi:hypothetical protein
LSASSISLLHSQFFRTHLPLYFTSIPTIHSWGPTRHSHPFYHPHQPLSSHLPTRRRGAILPLLCDPRPSRGQAVGLAARGGFSAGGVEVRDGGDDRASSWGRDGGLLGGHGSGEPGAARLGCQGAGDVRRGGGDERGDQLASGQQHSPASLLCLASLPSPAPCCGGPRAPPPFMRGKSRRRGGAQGGACRASARDGRPWIRLVCSTSFLQGRAGTEQSRCTRLA